MSKQPVVFDLEDEDAPKPSVSEAPPVPDMEVRTPVQAAAASIADPKPSPLARWVWGLLLGLVGTIISVAAWDYANGLVERIPLLGYLVSAAMLGLVLAVAIFALRELAALGRLRRVDALRQQVSEAREGDLKTARTRVEDLIRFYRGRADLDWARQNLSERQDEVMDADGLLDLTEAELMRPLDQRAVAEVEAASRQVATVTALVPLALADVLTALVSSLRMIRRIAAIYGGRSGALGSWRLIRAVLAHLVATGAVAMGEDFLEPVLGASVLSKLSRRFGEGLVNGALTARVGLAAMEVCRPMPFVAEAKPSTRKVIQRALTGLLSKSET